MPIKTPLQQFVDDELERSAELIARTRVGTPHYIKQSDTYVTAAGSARQSIFDVIETLQSNKTAYDQAFLASLQHSVLADLEEQSTNSNPLGDFGNSLTLVDEGRIESDIEIARVAQRIKDTAGWEMKELQAFTSTLCGHIHVIADTNPLRPPFYARALWDAACEVSTIPWQLKILLQASGLAISEELKLAWAAAATRLENQGIRPGIYRTAVVTPGTAIERNATKRGAAVLHLGDTVEPVTPPSTKTAFITDWPAQPQDYGSWPSLPHEALIAPAPAKTKSVPPRSKTPKTPDFQESLLNFEDTLNAIEIPSANAKRNSTTPSPRLRDHQAALNASTLDAVDRQVIDLLSRLFDNILSDVHLHPGFRALAARLQASVLRLALQEPNLMEDRQHPVWILMDLFGAASAPYPIPGDPRLATLLVFCEELVSNLTRAPTQDTESYAGALAQLNRWLDKLLQQQLMEAQPQVGQLAKLERRNSLKSHLSVRLQDQIGSASVSDTFRHFLTDSWAQVLAEAIQNYGELSEVTCGYVKAVDDLLWSIHPRNHTKSRARLLEMLPLLLQQLKSGMSSINLPTSAQEAVMAELMAMHTEGLRASPVQANELSADEAAAKIVQQLREDADDDLDSHHPFADSLIDVTSMETVPAELIESTPMGMIRDTPHRSRAHADIKVGVRLRIFMRGQWIKVQLLWRSPLGGLLLFAGESAGRTHSITESALSRLINEGLVLPMEDQTLFERASSAVIRELS